MSGRGCKRERARGSVLVPLVAAMLILLLTGVALTELFAAQRMGSVLDVETTRAFWVAEAGVWHAAYEAAAISPAVAFGGGTYAVTKSGDLYTATAVLGEASRTVSKTIAGGGGGSGPLDVAASVATVAVVTTKKFRLDLVSISATDLVIESFDLTADAGSEQAHALKLLTPPKHIWHEHAGYPMPTGLTLLNKGTSAGRTIAAGTSARLEYQSHTPPTGSVGYTLILNFTDGSSSTLIFTVAW